MNVISVLKRSLERFHYLIQNNFKTNYNYIMGVEIHRVNTIGPTKFYCFWVWQLQQHYSKYVHLVQSSTLKLKQISLLKTRCLTHEATAFNDSSHNEPSQRLYTTTAMTFQCVSIFKNPIIHFYINNTIRLLNQDNYYKYEAI